MDVLKNAYAEGLKNMDFHLSNSEILAKEANTALSLIMTAGLGSLGYTANLIDKGRPDEVIAGTLAVSAHLLLVAVLIVRRCLSADDVMPPTNEPSHLALEDFAWDDILRVEVANLNVRISFNQSRNKEVGIWLNKLRYAAFLVPITFVVAWAVAGVV